MPPFWRLWAVLSVARPPITVAAATTASYSSSPRPIIRTVRFGRARPSGRRALLGLTGFGLATWILSTRLDQLEGILDKALGDDTIHDLEQEEIDNEFQRVKAVYGSDTALKPNVDSNDGRILFLPLSRRRRSPTIRYSSNDPDWLSIVEFSANEDLKQTVLQALIDTVMSACLQQPLIARKLGPKPYSCRHMLEFQYLSLLSVGLEQDGLVKGILKIRDK